MYTFPVTSEASPYGPLIWAVVAAIPSPLNPATPVPATVLISPYAPPHAGREPPFIESTCVTAVTSAVPAPPSIPVAEVGMVTAPAPDTDHVQTKLCAVPGARV